MNFLYTSLVAAGVSALVALGIELFAKPRLEARKDRILEKFRARRRIVAIAREQSWRWEEWVINRRANMREGLEDEFLANRTATAEPRNRNNTDAMNSIHNVLYGDMYNPDAMDNSTILGHAADVLDTPIWLIVRRQIVIRKYRKAIEDAREKS